MYLSLVKKIRECMMKTIIQEYSSSKSVSFLMFSAGSACISVILLSGNKPQGTGTPNPQ